MKSRISTISILLLPLCFLGSLPADADGGSGTRVLCHYMPWFRAEQMENGAIHWEHWEWFGRGPKHDPDEILENGRRDIASVFYPLIGPYDGRDPSVLEYHFLSARAAGIEGFIADWYGPDGYTEEVFARMVETAEKTSMKVAICLEEKSFFPPYSDAGSRDAVLDEAERHIRHVLDAHGSSPAYLRENGRAVFYMFANHQQGVFGLHILTPEEIGRLLARFGTNKVLFVRQSQAPEYAPVIDGVFSWVGDHAYRTAFYEQAARMKAEGQISYIAGSAVPGFDNRGVWGWGEGPRIIERRGTLEYDGHWEDLLLHRPDAVQIVTWNDFGEGSTIEPAEEYGFTFLDRTEEWVSRLRGRPVCLNDNTWPYRIYRVRETAAGLSDAEARSRLERRADAFVSRMLKGKRFLMDWRLRRMEAAAEAAAAEQGDT